MLKSHRDKTDIILAVPDGQNRVHNIVPTQSYNSHMFSLYCLRCKLHFQKRNTENISFTYCWPFKKKKQSAWKATIQYMDPYLTN